MNKAILSILAISLMSCAEARNTKASFYYPTGNHSYCAKKGGRKVIGPWRQIAVPRSWLKTYPCGTEVLVKFKNGPVGGVRSFRAIVFDVIPSNKRIDILVSPRDNAMKFGIQKVTIRKV